MLLKDFIDCHKYRAMKLSYYTYRVPIICIHVKEVATAELAKLVQYSI